MELRKIQKSDYLYIKSFWGEENDDKALVDLIPILANMSTIQFFIAFFKKRCKITKNF